MFVEDETVVIGCAVLIPELERDKWNNVISEIKFPARSYRMVHHPSKNRFRASATIYAGKDKFVRFASYNSDRDTDAHTATIITAVGDFQISWGDGDCLGYYVPEGIVNHDALLAIKNTLHESKWGDSEEAFVLLTMQIIDTLPDNVWMNKQQWEEKKIALQEARYNRSK